METKIAFAMLLLFVGGIAVGLLIAEVRGQRSRRLAGLMQQNKDGTWNIYKLPEFKPPAGDHLLYAQASTASSQKP